jgi:hypothetical protein
VLIRYVVARIQHKSGSLFQWMHAGLFAATFFLLLSVSKVVCILYCATFVLITFICPHLIISNQKYKQYVCLEFPAPEFSYFFIVMCRLHVVFGSRLFQRATYLSVLRSNISGPWDEAVPPKGADKEQ